MGALIRVRRGPFSYLQNTLGNIPEGEPYEAGILLGDTTFELLYFGGHDGTNKLLGGGFQTCQGEPSFSAPAGASIFDTLNRYLWISNGDGTWTAFCPCFNAISGSGSGEGSSGIISPLCPHTLLPTTLHVTVSGLRVCTCLNGSFPITWDASQRVWASNPITGCPGQSESAYAKFRADTFYFGFCDSTSTPGNGTSDFSEAASVNCSPFIVSGIGSSGGNLGQFCSSVGDDGNMSWTVTL